MTHLARVSMRPQHSDATSLNPSEHHSRFGESVGIADVHYGERNFARAALVVCKGLDFSDVISEHVVEMTSSVEYESGLFYKRELPCLRTVVELAPRLQILVIDGYATLDPNGRPGLGAHVAKDVGIAVIGVAKTQFRGATHSIEVRRGSATKPLYVTAAGDITDREAAQIVTGMAGAHRLPTVARRVDLLARGRSLPVSPRR